MLRTPTGHTKKAIDLIAIGDATLDVFLDIHEASVHCTLKRNECQLCLTYGDKIPVENVIKVPGAGNASNAVAAARRLGQASAIVSVLGKDELGQQILKQWRKIGVNTACVQFDPKHETNYSTVLSFQGERTILIYTQPRSYRLPKLVDATWIYYTALGPKHEPLEKSLMNYLKARPNARLAFNPGPSQLHRGLGALAPVIARSQVLALNVEEAQHLLQKPGADINQLLQSFIALGAQHVLITDGAQGSHVHDGRQHWFCPIFPGPISERTGAGDGYATAFVVALHLGKTIAEAMRWGTANAWSIVQNIGPQAGQLDQRQMAAVLKKFHRIQPTAVI